MTRIGVAYEQSVWDLLILPAHYFTGMYGTMRVLLRVCHPQGCLTKLTVKGSAGKSVHTEQNTWTKWSSVTILSNINMYCFSYSFVLLEREAFWFVDCEHPQPPSGFSCCGCVCIAGSRWIVRSPSVTQTNPEKAGCGKLKYPRNHGCCFLTPVNTSFLEQFAKVQ